MSHVGDLVENYAVEVGLPWRPSLSPAERVWMLVHPPEQERRVRARLPVMELATVQAGHRWVEVDITDDPGRWLAGHEYAAAFFDDPSDLTSSVLDELAEQVATRVREVLDGPDVDGSTVVVLVGAAALHPFVRISHLVAAVDGAVRGRLLVLFPGRFDRDTSSYRLFDARDGFNYRARPITAERDAE